MLYDDFKTSVIQLFGPLERDFDGSQGRIFANNLKDAQNRIYRRLFDTLRNFPTVSGRLSRSSADTLMTVVGSQLSNEIKVAEISTGNFRVKSPIPLIDEADFHKWEESYLRDNNNVTLEVSKERSAFLIAALFVECLKSTRFKIQVPINGEVDIFPWMMEYVSIKVDFKKASIGNAQIKSETEILRHEVERNLADIRAQRVTFSDIENDYRVSLFGLQEKLETATRSIKSLEKELERVNTTQSDAVKVLAASSKKTISDHEVAIKKQIELQSIRQRWRDVKRRAALALAISGLVILILVALAIGLPIYFGQSVIDFLTPFNFKTVALQSSAAGAISMQLSRIVIVAVPVISYFWLMKIAVRLFMRSLMLMDDADQRATIMESYYTLTKDGMTDERALPMMLWAIFRPVPGHGPDGIEPPDFTEAINAGLKISPISSK